MVTYIIASKANSQHLAECEIIGEFLQANCNDVSVKTVIKHKTEWNDFLDSVCRTYGFKRKSCPIVYTIEGSLIGDASAFVEHVKDLYQKVVGFSKEGQKRRTQQNMKMINEEMRKKKEGLTLKEKIQKHLEKVKKKGLVSLIDDAFFTSTVENG